MMKVAILNFPGTSCETEVERLFQTIVKAEPTIVWHADATSLEAYDAVVIPNGAVYGNYLRPGALAKSSPAAKALQAFAQAGKPVVGLGNGFQVLVEIGLLPGAFLQNPSLTFQSGKAALRVNRETKFTNQYREEVITLPYAQQFATYYNDTPIAKEQIVMTFEENVFNSTQSIAALTNEGGNVCGIIALPERATEAVIGGTDGLPFFESILNNWSEQ